MIFYVIKIDGVIAQKGYTTSALTDGMIEITEEEYADIEG